MKQSRALNSLSGRDKFVPPVQFACGKRGVKGVIFQQRISLAPYRVFCNFT